MFGMVEQEISHEDKIKAVLAFLRQVSGQLLCGLSPEEALAKVSLSCYLDSSSAFGANLCINIGRSLYFSAMRNIVSDVFNQFKIRVIRYHDDIGLKVGTNKAWKTAASSQLQYASALHLQAVCILLHVLGDVSCSVPQVMTLSDMREKLD